MGNLYLSTEDIIYPLNEGGNIENILNFVPYLKQTYTNAQIGKIVSKLVGETYCEEVVELTKKYSLYNIKTKKNNHYLSSVIAQKCNAELTSFNILKIANNKYIITDLILDGKVYDNIIARNNGTVFNLYTHLKPKNRNNLDILAYINSEFLLGLGSISKQNDSRYPEYIPVTINIESNILNAYYDFHQLNIGKYTFIYNDQGVELILNKGLD